MRVCARLLPVHEIAGEAAGGSSRGSPSTSPDSWTYKIEDMTDWLAIRRIWNRMPGRSYRSVGEVFYECVCERLSAPL